MISTAAAILNSFELVREPGEVKGYFAFRFGDNKEYELTVEPLLFEDQMAIGLYKNQELLLQDKLIVKPGK